ncbi:HET-domain-containing protein [Colletotrichum asianum]
MKRPDGLVGYDYTWVDTCCIDKKSEVELSESLNSMYAWYRNSAVCIAHIEDFHGDDIDQATATNRWFTRGWTLQELIAPKDVIFYSGDWEEIGDKKKNSRRLEEITSIDRQVLLASRDLEDVSVAEKMKWISYRTTKKVEDMSYCMFGIFGINLPTIYGEGPNAFRRLQEEIIRTLDDVTIFLWKEEGNPNPFAHRGALARNSKEFRESRAPRTPLCVLPDPFFSTNKGIMMTTELYALKESFCAENVGLNKAHIRAEFRRGAIFALRFHEDKPNQHLNGSNTILLKRLLSTTGQYQYCRVL